MKTVDDIFHDLGGVTRVARTLDILVSTSGEMKRRGSIPVKYWQRLIDCPKGQEHALSSDILLAANSPEDKSDAA